MIDAIVVARHSDPEANKVMAVLDDHFAGEYNDNRVRQTVFSTLIGRGISRLGSHWSSVATPALLCHKEPARRIQSPIGGYFAVKKSLVGGFRCDELGLYGIR